MTRYARGNLGRLDQGDILAPVELRQYLPWWPEENKLPVVIVTPTCDIVQGKLKYHRLCVLQPFPVLLFEFGNKLGLTKGNWEGAEPLSKGKWKDLRELLQKAIKNGWPRYHFLPKEADIFKTDYVVDFELLITIPVGSLKEEQRHARMNTPFQQELIQRLTAHMMRIGTPDLTPALIDEAITGCIATTKLTVST